MVLFGENKVLDGCEEFMFSAQGTVQTVCVLVAVVCIPWMLLGTPIYIMCCGRKGGHGGVSNCMILLLCYSKVV